MKVWKEKEFMEHDQWFHATTLEGFKSILKNGILASFNNDIELDFGYGFYLTPNKEWAYKYAKGLYTDSESVVIEFRFKPKDIANGCKSKFYGKLDTEFADFVFNNRQYFMNNETHCVHDYDIVGGVMSDGNQWEDFELYRNGTIDKNELYKRLCIPKEDWQIVIHSQELCNKIKPFSAKGTKGGVYDVKNYRKAYS